MPEKISKLNTWASAIGGWGKILIGVIVFIVGVGTTYYQIQANAANNIRQDGQFHEMMETMKREFEISGQRSDKRYQRAMGEAEELHHEDDKLEKKIEKLQDQNLENVREIWYLKGKLGH